MYTTIIWLIIFIAIIGWLSLVKASLLSVNTNKIKMLADAGEETAIQLNKYVDKFGKLIAFVQVAITLLVLACGLVGIRSLSEPLGKLFIETDIKMHFNVIYNIAIILVTLIIGTLILIFGEFVPKCFGIKNADKVAYKNIKRIVFVAAIFEPIIFLINSVSNGILRLFGIDPNEVDANITEEEIRMMVDAGGDSGSIDENEKEMINNIFEFDNTLAGDIATHRTDIVAISLDADMDEIKEIIDLNKYSRIPVYNESIDDIVGIFHIKDMAQYLLTNCITTFEEPFDVKSIMRVPYYVPFSKKTDELMEEMQKNKVHMAIVIDEYGGTEGIVTMEDLLEEIVGNIFDEYDIEEEEDVQVVNDTTFLISGTAPIDEVQELLDFSLEEDEDYDTLGGFIIGHLGRIPDDDEMPEIVINDFKFKVEKIEDKRIDIVRVTRL